MMVAGTPGPHANDRCVCGHILSAHREMPSTNLPPTVLGCTIPGCACGPGCIHEGFVLAEPVCPTCEPGYEQQVITNPWDDLAECSSDTIATIMGAPLCPHETHCANCCEFCGGDHLAIYCGNK